MSRKKEVITLHYDNDRWGDYNSNRNNERKAELPIGAWFLEKFANNVIEIGEVMNSHIQCEHMIIDPAGEMPGTIKEDARNVSFKDKNVLSISTIEHVGDDDVDMIRRIQEESSNYLITFPIGYNRPFEKRLIDSGIEYFIIERSLDDNNNWTQTENKDFEQYAYNSPYYAGHAIAIMTNLNVGFVYKN